MDTQRYPGSTGQLPYDPNRLLPDDTNILVLDEDSYLSRKSTDSSDMQSFRRRSKYSNHESPYIGSDTDRVGGGRISTLACSYLDSLVQIIQWRVFLMLKRLPSIFPRLAKPPMPPVSRIWHWHYPWVKNTVIHYHRLACFTRVTACTIYPFWVIILIYNASNFLSMRSPVCHCSAVN